jgi:hypothetical protein
MTEMKFINGYKKRISYSSFVGDIAIHFRLDFLMECTNVMNKRMVKCVVKERRNVNMIDGISFLMTNWRLLMFTLLLSFSFLFLLYAKTQPDQIDRLSTFMRFSKKKNEAD